MDYRRLSESPESINSYRGSSFCARFGRRLVLFAIIIIVILASVITVIVYLETNSNQNKTVLGDVLPSSFSAEFKFYIKNGTKIRMDYGRNVTIEWNRDLSKFHYKEIRRNLFHFSQGVNKIPYKTFDTDLTVADGQAVLNMFLNGSWSWSCFTGMNSAGFYYTIQNLLNAELVGLNQTDCNDGGRSWYTGGCEQNIYFCEKNGSLFYIKQGQMLAYVTKWQTPGSNKIILPDHNATCDFSAVTSVEVPDDLVTSGSTNSGSSVHYKRKHCLFILGEGVEFKQNAYTNLTSFSEYWGNEIFKYTPYCSYRSFIRFNTIEHGWDSPSLQKYVCQFAGGTKSKIENKIIFAHSMGNLIIAAALHNKSCTFNLTTSKWFALQAPWKGSKVVNILPAICENKFRPMNRLVHPSVMVKVFKTKNYCNSSGKPSPAFSTLAPNYKSKYNGMNITSLIKIGRKHVSGSMCGVSSFGMGKIWTESSSLNLVSHLSKLEVPNDGIVSMKSCVIVGKFKADYKSKFYSGLINHFEGTCRYGEERYCRRQRNHGNMKPCSWFRNLLS